MNKNNLSCDVLKKKTSINHFLLIMRTAIILLFTCVFISVAETGHSQNAKVSLNKNNVNLKEVLNEIENQTDYLFIYNNEVNTNKTVSVNTKNRTVREVLNHVLRDSNIDFSMEGNHIILSYIEKQLKEIEEKTEIVQQKGKTITGTIVDAQGETIIGANIIEKGTSNGTITDFDGNFTLQVSEDAILRVSYIGYLEQEVATQGKNSIEVTLMEDTKTLDELVVVGYGIQKKVNVIGSIASIDSQAIESRTAPSVSNMLTGQMSGVTITQGSGRPGADEGTIRIRGVGSFGASPNPLVLIDGMPGNLNDINPADIESVSVLKDASSAAIYGSRAANGVLLVQTKSGKEGKVTVSYNGYFGWNQASELPEVLPSYEYAKYFNLATGTESYSPSDIQTMKDGSNTDLYANEMYLKDIIGGKGFQTSHEASINGGTEKTRYMVSLGYLKQNGLLEKNNFDRYNGRVNLVTQIHDNLSLTTRLSSILTDRDEPAIPGGFDGGSDMNQIVAQALRFPGLWPTVMSDGTWGTGAKLLGTPGAWMESDSFVKRSTKKVNTMAELLWNPLEGLNLKAIGGYNFTNIETKNYYSTLLLHGGRVMGPSELTNAMGNTAYKTLQFIADYGKVIKKHDFNVLLGYNWEDEQFRDINGLRKDFPSNDLPYLNAGSTDGQQSWGAGYDWAMQSFFGRLTYNYDERYLFETTMRYDGSSRFPKDNRWGFFPSVAAGWRVSEESFFKNNESLDFINNLKIKASLGTLGNNNIGNYPYQQVYSLDSNRSYIFGSQIYSGAAVTTFKDPSLTWEQTQTRDLGFESNFLNNKLTFNMAYFYRETTDILYQPSASYSSIFGLNLSPVNTGSLKNTGFEFELGHRNKINDFSYNVSGNFSIINNEVISLGIGNVEQSNGMIGNGSNLFIGHPMQMYYGYKTDGVFLTNEEVKEWADQSSIAAGAQAGDVRYLDLNNDGVVNEKDKTYLGSRIPKYTFGLNIGAEWKGFDFRTLLQGVAGVKGYLDNYAGFAFYQEGNLQRWQAEGSWSVNQTERYPDYPRLETMSNAGTPSTLSSDFWTLDGSYIKVRNVQLGYTLPKYISEKMGCSNFRIYFSSDNPLSFTKYREGWDPEINTSGAYYPILTTYTFGLNLKF